MQPAIIVNSTARSHEAENQLQRLRELLDQHGISDALMPVGKDEKLRDKVEEAKRRGCDPIVAGGGDGTINSVADALVGTSLTLGVLPLGTLNHFAKDLAIPTELDAALDTVLHGRTIQVDVGRVNERIFLNNSSLGIYPRLVRSREFMREHLGLSKWHAAFWAAISVLRRYPYLDVRLYTDSNVLLRRSAFILVGNNEYHLKGLDMVSRSRLDRGQLCLYTSRRAGRLGLLRFGLRALAGTLAETADFDTITTTSVEIVTRGRYIQVAYDGEIEMMQSPLKYEILPRALRVIVPTDPPNAVAAPA